MQLSTTLLYNDTPDYSGHMKIDLSKTQYFHFDVIEDTYSIDAKAFCQLLPEEVRPLRMSALCQQVPETKCVCVDTTVLSEMIMKFIENCDSLAIIKLFMNYIPHDISEDDLPVKDVTSFLKTLKIVCMKELMTQIILIESDTVIGRVNSEYYLEQSNSDCMLYIDSKLEDEDDIVDDISERLFQIISCHAPPNLVEATSSKIKHKLLNKLRDYIKAPSPSDKQKVLSKCHVTVVRQMTIIKFEVEIGQEIPQCYHHRLDQDPNNVFYPTEYVGYEDSENHIIVAQVVHLAEAGESSMCRMYFIYTSNTDPGMTVSILDLYKFLIGSGGSRSQLPDDLSAIVHFTAEDKVINLRRSLYERGDTTEVRKSISSELEEIWKFDLELRRKAIKRLYLRWHPNKNVDNAIKAEDAFIFLKEQIGYLETHAEVDNEEMLSEQDQTSSNTQSQSPKSGNRRDGVVSMNFFIWDQTAANHRQAFNMEQEIHAKDETNSPYSIFDQSNMHRKGNPAKGQCWVKQAEIDFNVLCGIHNSLTAIDKRYGHVCFMAHQVVEKALKGVMYAFFGCAVMDHRLKGLAKVLKGILPEVDVNDLDKLDDYYTSPRYPDQWNSDHIPSEKYEEEHAEAAIEKAGRVLSYVKSKMPQLKDNCKAECN